MHQQEIHTITRDEVALRIYPKLIELYAGGFGYERIAARAFRYADAFIREAQRRVDDDEEAA